MQGTQTDNSPLENLSTTWTFWCSLWSNIWSLQFECNMSLKIEKKNKMFSLEVSDYQDSAAKKRNNEFLVKYSYKSTAFSIEVWMEEIQLMAAENWKLEDRANAKWIALFRIFGRSRIRCMDQNKRFPNWIVLHKRKLLDGDFGWRNHSCGYWGRWVWSPKQNNKIKDLFNFVAVVIVMENSKKLVFSRIIVYKCQSFDWDFDFDATNEAHSCRELSVEMSIKIIKNWTFHKLLTFRILMQGRKTILLDWNSSSRVETFRLRHLLEIRSCILAQKWVLRSRKFNNNQSFWRYLNVDVTERYDGTDIMSEKNSIFSFG